MRIKCPNCHKLLTVKDDLAGKKGKCPNCGTLVRIPAIPFELAPAPSPEQGIPQPSISSRDPGGGSSSPREATPPGTAWQPTDQLQTARDFEEARKSFRGLGFTVVVLGLISLMFLGDASDELITATLVVIAFCTIAGIWHVIAPSIASGITAGVSLAILGITDLALCGEGSGLFSMLPVLIDFGWAIRMFVGCVNYSKVVRARG